MAVPVANATKSFWRSDPQALDNHRTTEQLPAKADIVIIGAGYAGASITHHLLEKSKALGQSVSIVILEAREACSGATGRNGGHVKPDPYNRAAGALKTHGKEAAEEVASFEARQVKEVQKLVERENIDCDFVVTRATDVCMYEGARKDLKQGLDALTEANVSTASEVHYSDARTAQGVSYSIFFLLLAFEQTALKALGLTWQKTIGIGRQRSPRLLHIYCSPRLAIQARAQLAHQSREARCKLANTHTRHIRPTRPRTSHMGSRNISRQHRGRKSHLRQQRLHIIPLTRIQNQNHRRPRNLQPHRHDQTQRTFPLQQLHPAPRTKRIRLSHPPQRRQHHRRRRSTRLFPPARNLVRKLRRLFPHHFGSTLF